MSKTYRVTAFRRFVNTITSFLARRGKGPASELTTIGRRSGLPRTVPVTPILVEGRRYLVSPYGAVGWVHNIRTSGTATLSRGGRDERIEVVEVSAEEAGPVLMAYWKDLRRIVGPFFDVPDEPTVADFIAEAAAHPVFRIETGG